MHTDASVHGRHTSQRQPCLTQADISAEAGPAAKRAVVSWPACGLPQHAQTCCMAQHLSLGPDAGDPGDVCRSPAADAKLQRDVRKVLDRMVRRVEKNHMAAGATLCTLC